MPRRHLRGVAVLLFSASALAAPVRSGLAQATGGAAVSADQTLTLSRCRWGPRFEQGRGLECTLAAFADGDSITFALSRAGKPDAAIRCPAEPTVREFVGRTTGLLGGAAPAGVADTRMRCARGSIAFLRTLQGGFGLEIRVYAPRPPGHRTAKDGDWEHDPFQAVLTPGEAEAFVAALRAALAG